MTPPTIYPKCLDTPAKRKELDRTDAAIQRTKTSLDYFKREYRMNGRMIAKLKTRLKKLQAIRKDIWSGKIFEQKSRKTGWQHFETEE